MSLRFLIFIFAIFSYPFTLMFLLLGINSSKRISSKEFLKLVNLYRGSLDVQCYIPRILWFIFTLLYWYHQVEEPVSLFSTIDLLVISLALGVGTIGRFVKNFTEICWRLLVQLGIGISLAMITLYPLGFLQGRYASTVLGREMAVFSLIAIIFLKTANFLLRDTKPLIDILFYFIVVIATIVPVSILRYALATVLFFLLTLKTIPT